MHLLLTCTKFPIRGICRFSFLGVCNLLLSLVFVDTTAGSLELPKPPSTYSQRPFGFYSTLGQVSTLNQVRQNPDSSLKSQNMNTHSLFSLPSEEYDTELHQLLYAVLCIPCPVLFCSHKTLP